MHVRQVDEAGDETGIELQRFPVRGRSLLELGLVSVVQRRAQAKILFSERRVALAVGAAWRGRRPIREAPERQDFRRGRVEAEIERELTMARRDQTAGDGPE